MYTCTRCGKSLKSQISLDYHMTHNVCVRNDRICPKCGAKFDSKRNCLYHIEQNVCKHHKLKLTMKASYENMSKDELIEKLNETEKECNTLKQNSQQINNNTLNQNNIIIFPTAFGREDINHIQQILGDICGPLIKNHTFKSIPTLFSEIHNNKRLPEYHNVFTNSERSNFALVSNGIHFNYKPKKNVIDQIIEDKRSILNKYVDENGDQLGEKVLEKYDKYQEQIDSNSEFRKNLEMEIACSLLNMKSVIADDEKTRKLLEQVDNGQLELESTQS